MGAASEVLVSLWAVMVALRATGWLVGGPSGLSWFRSQAENVSRNKKFRRKSAAALRGGEERSLPPPNNHHRKKKLQLSLHLFSNIIFGTTKNPIFLGPVSVGRLIMNTGVF